MSEITPETANVVELFKKSAAEAFVADPTLQSVVITCNRQPQFGLRIVCGRPGLARELMIFGSLSEVMLSADELYQQATIVMRDAYREVVNLRRDQLELLKHAATQAPAPAVPEDAAAAGRGAGTDSGDTEADRKAAEAYLLAQLPYSREKIESFLKGPAGAAAVVDIILAIAKCGPDHRVADQPAGADPAPADPAV